MVNHSSNGMFVEGARVERVAVARPVSVMLGSASSGELVQLAPGGRPEAAAPQPVAVVGQTTVARPPTAVHAIDQLVVTIGRGPDNDVVLNDLLVSRRHAMLRRSGSQWELVDNNSANGTYVNGTRISRALLGPSDIVGIGHQLLHLSGDRLVEYVDTGDISYEAANLRVVTNKGSKKSKVLLADVSFALPQRSLLAVVGPSGAGKSTLLGALTGFRPATSGSVRYDDRDLYDNYAELRHRIGFVPQDDILHTPLTVRRALNYAARLRFPHDVSAAERNQRIQEVLTELGLSTQADQRIDSLSGGQRKRTSVALELLTKPSLLFLDEPTSGLDPGYEKSVMQTLRSLADDGRSVVVVTHNIAHLNMCDRLLILAPGGRLAYFGPPQQALSYFHCTDFADLFTLLERDTTTDWTARFYASPLHAAVTAHPAPNPAHPTSAHHQSPGPTKRAGPIRHLVPALPGRHRRRPPILGVPAGPAAAAEPVRPRRTRQRRTLTGQSHRRTLNPTLPTAGTADHRRRTDGLRGLHPRNRQRTSHLPPRTRHRPIRQRLPSLQTRRPDRTNHHPRTHPRIPGDAVPASPR
ncbi:ABC transporter family protein [Mycobacterium kansasii]|uniref:ABC transporter family protein n=1 Tax=Mycobacterium kansasii TaxID=1768 RepID=A0A1V3XN56_MYCKA|nr:ABC transporter family protein [Mycobacterium kansasii]